MGPILITGASGFLGSQVVTELCRKGYCGRLHLMLRKQATSEGALGHRFRDARIGLDEIHPRTHLVDLTNEEVFLQTLQAFASISRDWTVIHLAAVINAKDNLLAQEKVNFDRTVQLLEWSNQHARHFIYTSSIVAFGGTPRPTWRTEADYDSYHWLNRTDTYSSTKRQAHDEILSKSKIKTTIFCPGIIHGAYENLKSSREHLKKVAAGEVKVLPGGGGAFVSLDHVVEEILAAATEEPGTDKQVRVKMLADVCITYAEYFKLYRQSLNLPDMGFIVLPSFLCWPLGILLGFLKIFKVNVSILSKALQASLFYYFKTGNAEQGRAVLRQAIAASVEKKA